MKLHFEPDLGYQLQAIESVCDLFRGQEINRTEFTVIRHTANAQQVMDFAQSDLGIGNRLQLLDDAIHSNLKEVQLRNGLPPSSVLPSGDFTVEMETGTGKTYVYLRTIFELNKRYGFTKFIIVVPSVAIKEGVYKSLQITEEHFQGLYANTPYEYFLYDSSQLGQVRNFATSPHIQIMVMTVGAINKKDVNNIYQQNEKTGGEKPIDLIRSTLPIVIVDEPQSVDGGLTGKGKEALDAMRPLCTLRYSATHVNKHQMLYRLDAVDAYERKLVKQIEVASASVEGDHNVPYIRVIDVSNKRNVISVTLELDVQKGNQIKREPRLVQDTDDLEDVTNRALYANYTVGEIRTKKGEELVEIRMPGSERYLSIGEAIGGVDEDALKRQMLKRTIKEHLDKELRLRSLGVKVLSLFFIDRVDHYRWYDEDGQPQKGKYARMFEEEYSRLIRHPDYRTLYDDVDLASDVSEVHNGYFSIDKKGSWVDTAENTQANRESAERAYNLIMKDKERLLSFSTPLKFIFSHSALKEGWDSPNVFQICNLREMGSERERRQTIGRGLRLCVNQEGERLRGFDINTLTVVATESYQKFAEELQKEIEADTGIRFGVVSKDQFAIIPVVDEQGVVRQALGSDQSEAIWDFLHEQEYINGQGRIQDNLRRALRDETLVLPDAFSEHQPQIVEILRKLAGGLDIKDANEKQPVHTRQAILHSEDFKALWDRVKYKTTYRVEFDNEALIQRCIKDIQNGQPVPRARLQWRMADLAIGRAGVSVTETNLSDPVTIDSAGTILPDILTDLQDKTHLTRRSLTRILIESGRLKDFARNPQFFIDLVSETINRAKRTALVDGIKYQRLGDDYYYAQELFEENELTGYLKNMLEVQRSVHTHVVYDSAGVEKSFAEELEHNEAIRVYAKLPGWFTIPTPLGTYNPDWAVLIDRNGDERIYFVVETKSSLFTDDLRDRESAKIECGKAHFKTLSTPEQPILFTPARNLDDVFARIP